MDRVFDERVVRKTSAWEPFLVFVFALLLLLLFFFLSQRVWNIYLCRYFFSLNEFTISTNKRFIYKQMHTLIYMHSVTVFSLNFKDNGDYFNHLCSSGNKWNPYFFINNLILNFPVKFTEIASSRQSEMLLLLWDLHLSFVLFVKPENFNLALYWVTDYHNETWKAIVRIFDSSLK